MPEHVRVQILRIVDRALAEGGLRLRIDLGCGQEHVLGRIPVHPGVIGNGDLRGELQGHPVQGLDHGQAFLNHNLGALDALGVNQARVRVRLDTGVAGAADQHHVIDPVGARDRVPGLRQHAGHGDRDGAAQLTYAAEGLGPQAGPSHTGVQVSGHRDVLDVRGDAGGVNQPDAVRVLHRQPQGLLQQLLTLF